MDASCRHALSVAFSVTIMAVGLWLVTDAHWYTKYQVVERTQQAVDPDDLLAGTGFYDDEIVETTLHKDEFHLGLLPTPQGVFDKHALSVVTIAAPFWAWFLFAFRRAHRRVATPLAPVISPSKAFWPTSKS